MSLTVDQKELITSYALTFIECYKVFMACLLSIFVPQLCPETNTTCTLKENFSDLSRFNEFVIVFNFFTLGLFCTSYYYQSKRETYIITHLDMNKDKGDNTLEENLKDKTHSQTQQQVGTRIFNKIKYYNQLVFKLARYSTIIFIMNTAFSCVLIFYYFYDGFRSVTTLIANVLLVTQKLYSMYTITNNSISTSNECKKELALSLTRLEPVAYNDYDQDYIIKEDGTINRRDTTILNDIKMDKQEIELKQQ